jgi:hypothetical protein
MVEPRRMSSAAKASRCSRFSLHPARLLEPHCWQKRVFEHGTHLPASDLYRDAAPIRSVAASRAVLPVPELTLSQGLRLTALHFSGSRARRRDACGHRRGSRQYGARARQDIVTNYLPNMRWPTPPRAFQGYLSTAHIDSTIIHRRTAVCGRLLKPYSPGYIGTLEWPPEVSFLPGPSSEHTSRPGDCSTGRLRQLNVVVLIGW